VFSGAEAQVPQINLEVDRERARLLGLDPSAIYAELQATLGGQYVTDFNKFGRTWTVQIQAAAQHRANYDDLIKIYVKNRDGKMVPLSLVAKTTLGVGPSSLMRYNNYPAVTVRGSAAPGVGDGTALSAMDEISETTLPPGFKYEWTGQALEERASAAQTPLVLGMALLFAFFLLVGLYESWSMPMAALLPVVIAVFGAMLGLYAVQASLLLYTEIGIIVLIALAAKNSILMTQFFIDQRKAGKSIFEAAGAGARQRIRPVMMTSVAFIAALVPLLIASGPGEASMFSVALPVFAGMLMAALIGVFFIPMMYVVMQHIRERGLKLSGVGQRAGIVPEPTASTTPAE
jgi:multidrug efflux pump subunit AcrB